MFFKFCLASSRKIKVSNSVEQALIILELLALNLDLNQAKLSLIKK